MAWRAFSSAAGYRVPCGSRSCSLLAVEVALPYGKRPPHSARLRPDVRFSQRRGLRRVEGVSSRTLSVEISTCSACRTTRRRSHDSRHGICRHRFVELNRQPAKFLPILYSKALTGREAHARFSSPSSFSFRTRAPVRSHHSIFLSGFALFTMNDFSSTVAGGGRCSVCCWHGGAWRNTEGHRREVEEKPRRRRTCPTSVL